jgi:hypothetical protein
MEGLIHLHFSSLCHPPVIYIASDVLAHARHELWEYRCCDDEARAKPHGSQGWRPRYVVDIVGFAPKCFSCT